MPRSVLLIDDDVRLFELLREYLPRFDFSVEAAHTSDQGLIKLRQNKPDLIILDVMLPPMNGFELCKKIRMESQVPIIMLTARGDVTDRIVGLELGADDYLAKPFEPRELVVRMESILRRAGPSSAISDRLVFGDLILDRHARRASLKGELLELSTAEFSILEVFAQNPGRTFLRQQLIDHLHGTDWATVDRSVDVLVSRLRHKIGDDPKQPRFIKTVWGTGYRFIGKQG